MDNFFSTRRLFSRTTPLSSATAREDRNSGSSGSIEAGMTRHGSIQKAAVAHRRLDGSDATDYDEGVLKSREIKKSPVSPVQDAMPTTSTGGDDSSDTIMESPSSAMLNPLDEAVKSVEQATNLHQREDMREMAALKDRVAVLENEVHFAHGELRKVKEREQKLLDKILDKTQGEQFYDSDLARSFRNIREEVQRLAKSPLYATSSNNRRPWVAEQKESEELLEQWHTVPRKERQLLMRKHMFEHLNQYFFGGNYFGLSSGEMTSREAAVFRRMEANLSDFESEVQHRGVDEEAIADWRVATLKCIRLGRLTQNPGAEFAGKIFRRFERFTVEDLSDSDLEKLRKRILQLCQDAASLQLRMRSSHESYECWVPREGTDLAGVEDWAEGYAVFNGNDNDMGREVCFALFGALVKRPKYQSEGELVLEKAQVVTFAHH